MRSKLVLIDEAYKESRKIESTSPALVIRGPYEYSMQITKKVISCVLVYDVMIGGIVYPRVPCSHCKNV